MCSVGLNSRNHTATGLDAVAKVGERDGINDVGIVNTACL